MMKWNSFSVQTLNDGVTDIFHRGTITHKKITFSKIATEIFVYFDFSNGKAFITHIHVAIKSNATENEFKVFQ